MTGAQHFFFDLDQRGAFFARFGQTSRYASDRFDHQHQFAHVVEQTGDEASSVARFSICSSRAICCDITDTDRL